MDLDGDDPDDDLDMIWGEHEPKSEIPGLPVLLKRSTGFLIALSAGLGGYALLPAEFAGLY